MRIALSNLPVINNLFFQFRYCTYRYTSFVEIFVWSCFCSFPEDENNPLSLLSPTSRRQTSRRRSRLSFSDDDVFNDVRREPDLAVVSSGNVCRVAGYGSDSRSRQLNLGSSSTATPIDAEFFRLWCHFFVFTAELLVCVECVQGGSDISCFMKDFA